MFHKKIFNVCLVVLIILTFVSCTLTEELFISSESASTSAEMNANGESINTEYSEEAIVIIEGSSIPNGAWNLEYLKTVMPDVNFESRIFDNATIEQEIKTAFAVGESVDLTIYWPNKMNNFLASDMVLDLTPYLVADPEWSDNFLEGALNVGTYDEKVYAIPDSTVYPLIIVNTAIFEKADLEIKNSWTWDEFMAAADAIMEKTEAFPIGIRKERATWFVRNGFLQIWDDEAELEKFVAGKIPFTDSRVKELLDTITGLYDGGYCYPGMGAISATQDAIMEAFSNGEIAMMADVNAMAKADIEASGLLTVDIVSWPTMGNGETDYILGGATGYFIPSNVKNPDFSIEILKHLTSQPVFENAAANGTVVPVAVESTLNDPFAADYAKDSYRVAPAEVHTLTSELFDYIQNYMPSNYLLYGDEAISEMNMLRIAALED